MSPIEICIQPVTALSADDQQAVHEVDRIAFASDAANPDPYTWSQGEWQLTGWVDGKIVSIVGILERTALAGQQTIRLGGIGGVATLPEYRARGLAGALLRASVDFMRDSMHVDFGLLFCGDGMVPYYRKFGWQVISDPVVFDQPGGKTTWKEAVMILPVLKSTWPPGPVDLCGLPW